ncbi:AMP-binding protein [Ottowia thiooxydans]|uniref:AMP-binding protein n=1 Tax=Ottowia thiooxydans TaxID=219182 RepID=UPI00042A5BDF|nr:AMP-binding protein [Ottowia thiooxydans]
MERNGLKAKLLLFVGLSVRLQERFLSIRPIHCLDDVRAIESRPFEEYLPYTSVMHALEVQAQKHSNRVALQYIKSADLAEPSEAWTYLQFVAQVRRTARLFQSLCGNEQPRVGFLLPAIPQAHFTLWGAEAVGIACPINYLLGEEHIAELILAAKVNVLVVLGPHPELDIWSRVDGIRQRCPQLLHVLAVGGGEAFGAGEGGALNFDQAVAAQSDEPLSTSTSLDDVAALFHTGGTTGSPKLAQHLHRNQLCAAAGAACMYGASDQDVIINGFPLFHVAGSFVYGLSMFLVGATVVLPTLLGMRNPGYVQRYWHFAERERATLLAAVPTVMSSLLTVPASGADISRIRCLLTGGSPLPPDLAEAFERQFSMPVRNILGMTECGGIIAIEPCAMPRTAGSVGLPIPFVKVRAVNANGEPVPEGEDGELQIKGPNVSPGYTDATKNSGLFLDGGWLNSGDVGHLDSEGRLYVTGRAKDMIIRSSHNIDPLLIEDTLHKHPDVAMAAAVGAPDEYAGELPVVYISLKPGATADAQALLAFAEQHVPERPAVPKQIFILDTLPMTAIGKFFKPRLREMATQHVIDSRLVERSLQAKVVAQVQADHKGVQVVFHCGDDAGAAAAVKEMMVPFAVRWRLADQRDSQGAGV